MAQQQKRAALLRIYRLKAEFVFHFTSERKHCLFKIINNKKQRKRFFKIATFFNYKISQTKKDLQDITK